jgi:hypothetical protein
MDVEDRDGGTVRATSVPSGLSGAFSGTFTHWQADQHGGYTWASSCESDSHQFALTR